MAGLTRVARGAWGAVRIGGGVAIVAGAVVAVGTGPFLRGIAAVSPAAILAAGALAAVAAGAAAWRWQIVAAGLGLPLTWREAFAAYYRSQFLNTVLPGGVLGDVHRAYHHGQRHDRLGAAGRSVAVERVAGQIVQLTLTLVVLVCFGVTSVAAPVAWAGLVAVAVAAGIIGALGTTRRGRRMLRREIGMLRPLWQRPRTLLAVAGASSVVVVATAGMFVVAGMAVGVAVAPHELALVGLVVLGAAAIPVNVGGWGPREVASAAAFALAGLDAGAGVAVSTAFGVLTMVAVAPGAIVLMATWAHAVRVSRIRSQRGTA
mgnify:CR=1 FL=1